MLRKRVSMHTKKIVGAHAACCMFLVGQALGQTPMITSLQGNGTLTWTNNATNVGYRIEWIPSLNDRWKQSWQPAAYVESFTNTVFAVKVPMFYRVAMVTSALPSGMVLVDASSFQMGNSRTNGIDKR